MCGRYATTRSEADLSDLFDAVDVTEGLGPSWNVAPTDPVPIVRVSLSHGARVLDTARWGLVPPWAKDTRGAARMINARSETVATSPAFAPSFARRRCLVPADGWFEWLRDGKQKQAYYMTPADGSPLAFAGIWSPWGPEQLLTCSVLTTAATGHLKRVHDRMPLILPRDRWAAWLAGADDRAFEDTDSTDDRAGVGGAGGVSVSGAGRNGAGAGGVSGARMSGVNLSAAGMSGAGRAGTGLGGSAVDDLLRPMTDRQLEAIEVRPVGPAVGNVRNNGPHLLEPPTEAKLF